MKRYRASILTAVAVAAILMTGFGLRSVHKVRAYAPFVPPKGCVFRTVMGEESSEAFDKFKTPEKVQRAVDRGLGWMARAQQQNGGWGAGTHARQDVIDPHAVAADPATTAMVSMALLRSGSTLTGGVYKTHLARGLQYLLQQTESASAESLTITDLRGTQIQTKLGANIDVILAAQFFSNILPKTNHDPSLHRRVKKALDICVGKIQRAQDETGNISGAGWAGVLQSSLATNALEAAQSNGAVVDKKALQRARAAQKDNFDTKSGDVKTDRGAGIVLYSVSGSARASAKEARIVEEKLSQARKDGSLPAGAPPSAENLAKIGFSNDDAMRYATAYEVYQAAKETAQRDDVMSGFGNNGGEEFLSYLQTGEGMVINNDNDWQHWYNNVSGRMINIQNEDGSWNGHHCITSPVFCTATSILILSINNDIEALTAIGKVH